MCPFPSPRRHAGHTPRPFRLAGLLSALGLLAALAAVPALAGANDVDGGDGGDGGDEKKPARAADEAATEREDARASGALPRGPQERVVVTAGGREERALELPVHASVVEGEELARAPALALDEAIAARVPAFSLFRRTTSLYAHPTTQGLNLRALGPSGTSRALVLLDGVPLNDPFGGWVHWSRMPRASLERVEILRGGASELWGDAALGGALSALTRAPGEQPFTLRALGGEDSSASVELAGDTELGERVGALSFDIARFTTRGHVLLSESERGPVDEPASLQVSRAHARYERPLGEGGARLRAMLNLFEEERGNGTDVARNETRGGFLSVGLRTPLARAGLLDAQAWAVRHDFENVFAGVNEERTSEAPVLSQDPVRGDAFGARLTWLGTSGPRVAGAAAFEHVARLELSAREGQLAERFFFSGEPPQFLRERRARAEDRLVALSFGTTWRLPERGLSLSAGARVDRWELVEGFRVEEALDTGETLGSLRLSSRDETLVSPRLGLVWRASESLVARAAAYRAFRAPTPNELVRPFRVRSEITAANPALEPERLTGAEAGITWLGTRHELTLTASIARLDDAVANVTIAPGPGFVDPCGFVPQGGVCRQRQNLGHTLTEALEAEALWRASPSLTLRAGLLLSDAEVGEAPAAPELEGRRVPQVPRARGSLSAELALPLEASLLLALSAFSRQNDDDLGTRTLAGGVVADASLRLPLGRGVSLSLAGRNLLDTEIETARTAEGLVSLGAPRRLSLALVYAP